MAAVVSKTGERRGVSARSLEGAVGGCGEWRTKQKNHRWSRATESCRRGLMKIHDSAAAA